MRTVVRLSLRKLCFLFKWLGACTNMVMLSKNSLYNMEVATLECYRTLDSWYYSKSQVLKHLLVMYDACALGFPHISCHRLVIARGWNPMLVTKNQTDTRRTSKMLILSTNARVWTGNFKVLWHIGFMILFKFLSPHASSSYIRCMCFGILDNVIASTCTWSRVSPTSQKWQLWQFLLKYGIVCNMHN